MPELIGLCFVLWPGRFFPTQFYRGVGFKIDRLLQNFFHLADALVDALLIEIVDFVGRLEISEQNIIRQRGSVFGSQRFNILLREKEMAEIEELEVVPQEFL